MRRLVFGWAMWSVACAGADAARGSRATATPALDPPSGACVSALFLVDQDVATASAVDPVETRMALTQSRAFSRGAAPEQDPRGVLATERLGRSALFRVKVRAEPARAQSVCAFASQRLLTGDRDADAAAREWLEQQVRRIEEERQKAADALRDFDTKHELLAVDLQAQLDLLRAELKELLLAKQRGKAGLDGVLTARKDQARELELVRIERERLVARVDGADKLLQLTKERSAEQQIGAMFRAPVRLVDACAPCTEPAR